MSYISTESIPRAQVAHDHQGQGRQVISLLTVNDDNLIEQRPIQLGPLIDGLRAAAGLAPGEWVITSGIQQVRPGIVVTPQRSTMPEATRVAGARAPSSPPEEA